MYPAGARSMRRGYISSSFSVFLQESFFCAHAQKKKEKDSKRMRWDETFFVPFHGIVENSHGKTVISPGNKTEQKKPSYIYIYIIFVFVFFS